MEAFAKLFNAIDRSTRTSEKVAALENYLRTAPGEDAAWAVWFLSGNRLKRAVNNTLLRQWAAETAGIPAWLLDDCYETVGDLGETLALILPPPKNPVSPKLSALVEQRLVPLASADENNQRELLLKTWDELDARQKFLWHKLIMGGFRVGLSRALIAKAMANVAGIEPAVMTHRIMGQWPPTASGLAALLSKENAQNDLARPFPFFLASPLEKLASELGEPSEWQCEWKWDGIRAQIIRHAGQCILWSRGEEIITSAFPEIAAAAMALPDGTVVDGEILAWRGDSPLPFSSLQRRVNRVNPGRKLREEIPATFLAFDLLAFEEKDFRNRPLAERRRELEKLVSAAIAKEPGIKLQETVSLVQPDFFSVEKPIATAPCALRLSSILPADTWEEISRLKNRAREHLTEGVMLKRRDSPYGTGRQRGNWWKWKVDPFTADLVLVAAQPGHGRRATLFTDYTFAVWKDGELVPVAKAYSGLTDEEINEVDAFVRKHTTGKFGPVRSVQPLLVFELAFEGIAISTRHKAGLALRFPRIARRRTDKTPAQADTLETLQTLASTA